MWPAVISGRHSLTYPNAEAHGKNKKWPQCDQACWKTCKAAVIAIGLLAVETQWSGHGSRYQSALALAQFLQHAVVFIKSET